MLSTNRVWFLLMLLPLWCAGMTPPIPRSNNRISLIDKIYAAVNNPSATGNRANIPAATSTTTAPQQSFQGPGDCRTFNNLEGKCVSPLYCADPPNPAKPEDSYDFRQGLTCRFQTHCCPLGAVLDKPKKIEQQLPEKVCGVTYPGGHNFRASRDPGFSDYAEFPWMVAILRPGAGATWTNAFFIGGGTLIHPSVVLTVAHKFQGYTPTMVKCRAGEWDAATTDEMYSHQDRDVEKIMIHEQFNRRTAAYDAALLILKSPFTMGEANHIGVACLGSVMPATGTRCYSMGWGKSLKTKDYVNLLKKVELPLVDSMTCTEQLRRTKLGPVFRVRDTLMCAGGEEGLDTCTGDGGSSLVCPLPKYNQIYSRHAVFGMVAFGVDEKCGWKDVPGVYVDVPMMLNWINDKMDQEKLSKDYLM